MEITEETVKSILSDYFKLTREVQISRYDRNHRKYQLKDKNQDILNAFFRSVKVSFEDRDKRVLFQQAVEIYFLKLQSGPLSGADVEASINEIEALLYEQKNNILYNRFLSILTEYVMQ